MNMSFFKVLLSITAFKVSFKVVVRASRELQTRLRSLKIQPLLSLILHGQPKNLQHLHELTPHTCVYDL